MNIYQFTPSQAGPFSFQDQFDFEQCSVIVTFSAAAQRFYINIYNTVNALILCSPLIGSPPTQNISMTAGYFNTQLIYRPDLQQIQVI